MCEDYEKYVDWANRAGAAERRGDMVHYRYCKLMADNAFECYRVMKKRRIAAEMAAEDLALAA